MNRNRLQYLLERYQKSVCSAEELKELDDWYRSLNYGDHAFEQEIKSREEKEQLSDILFEGFQKRLANEKEPLPTINRWYPLAAAAVLLFVAGAVLFFVYPKTDVKKPSVASNKTQILPGSNKAILTLADGEQVVLDDATTHGIPDQYGMKLTRVDSSLLTYSIANGRAPQHAEELAYNTIETPRGGQYQVMLPDGTKVWLNAATILRYPVKYSTNERKVELSGEAYFEVAANKSQPFIVVTGKQEINVLGTHVNVKSYKDEQLTSTTLISGSVRVHDLNTDESVILTPGQQANTRLMSKKMSITAVNAQDVVSWKNGYMVFDNQDIYSIMKVISRWYNVDVVYSQVDKKERFGGTFSRYAHLQHILENLEQIGSARFSVQGREVVVSNRLLAR
ncbi:DUF4974 domain-containing protein [Olivibacter ginsenosidimutans]|uniref:DUF4974 domain-containing protein n=1 Tax=Olivibacter ginsenosidimutans TaxID=1176537 RepID=A0ABP9B9K9_9SPHI